MLSLLVFLLVGLLLIADAVIFFAVGFAVATKQKLEGLKEEGWHIEPPEEEYHDH